MSLWVIPGIEVPLPILTLSLYLIYYFSRALRFECFADLYLGGCFMTHPET